MTADSVKLVMQLLARLSVVLPDGYSGGAASQSSYRTVTLDDFGADVVLDGDNTPTPTAVLAKSYELGAGDTTIDLTDAPIIGAEDGNGAPVDGEDLTGYKLQAVIVETPSDNAGDITIKPAAANGYPLWGTSNEFDFPPRSNLGFLNQASELPDVGAATKDIVLSGTEGDVANLILVFEA